MIPSQPASYLPLSHAAVMCMQTNNNGNNYNVCAVAKYDFIFTYISVDVCVVCNTFGIQAIYGLSEAHFSAQMSLYVEQNGCGNSERRK